MLSGNLASGIQHIRENTAWPQKDEILANHAIIDGHVILYPHAPPKSARGRNIHILSQRTFLPDNRSGSNMRKMPDPASRTDACARIDDRRAMYY